MDKGMTMADRDSAALPNRLRQIFLPPRYETDDKTRAAQFLNAILIAGIALLGVRVFTGALKNGGLIPDDMPLFLLMGVMAILLVVMRKGYVRAASIVLVGLVLVIMVYVANGSEGIHDGAFFVLTAVVVMASLLIDWKASAVVAALSIAAGWWLAQKYNGVEQVLEKTSSINFARDSSIVFVLLVVIMYLIVNSLRGALTRSRASEQRLRTQNAELTNLRATLEDRVQSRTAQLRASAEVSHAATSILNPEQLLKQIADLITDRFGFYYTGVFVLDEASQQAVLRAATGEAGQVLLARNHHLPVDEKSMVGAAILTGHPRIALDVGQEAVRFANPLLPNTRSEIALPLRVGDRTLGALDAQSEQASVFDENSTEVLQSMADQIAVALFNAESFQRSQRQASVMTTLNQLSRSLAAATSLEDVASIVLPVVTSLLGPSQIAIVQKTANPQLLALREFTPDPDRPVGDSAAIPAEGSLIGECIARAETIYTPDLSALHDQYSDVAGFYDQGLRSGIILPLRVGDRVLGTFNVGAEQAHAYAADHINQLEQVTSQVAVTIENLNLAEQTQQTLAELDAANRQLVGQAWGDYTRLTKLDAAEWRNGIWSVLENRTAQRETSQALVPAAPPLSLPIKVRGATIGEFHITAADAQQVWDPEDTAFAQSLVDQVGQVLETARLLDETERTAHREKAVADAADKIHRSIDIDTVLQSAVTELQRITGRRGISVQLGFGRTTPPGTRAPDGDTGGDR
jgi:GAF domain-containing protein